MLLICIIIVYMLIPHGPDTFQTKKDEKENDVFKIPYEKKELTNQDNKIIPTDTSIEVTSKEKQKIKHEYNLLAYIDIAEMRGGENIKFIKLVNNKTKSAELLVYKEQTKLELKEETIKKYVKSGKGKLYIFPRTELNISLKTKYNCICDIEPTPDGNYILYISESGETKDCENTESVKYLFDREFNFKNLLDFTEKFEETYTQLQKDNKIKNNLTVDAYKDYLKTTFINLNDK